jgi:hypothetical protein
LTAEIDYQQLLPIVEKLAKMEGLLLGLQNDLKNTYSYTAAAIAKVETLEKRQVELERSMVTKADIAALLAKVDTLVSSDASRKGATNVATWSITNLVPYLALLVSLLALVGVGTNRQNIIDNIQQPSRMP